ncbi:ATP-dependent DNA helicase [Paenibacillus sp. GCM10027626]|uniref:ATP-dependent DNA helicase n=1 Tax=Paenibacillus sp. GCM10027626 TaxID=3273411 RepID=UPI00363F65A5
MERYPFRYDHSRPFIQQVGEWIGDVFYDVLPESGFEVRDEQIYMAYQLERAFADKETIFAEAGVGTGKTLVYLLYAVCYARYKRQPVIIACADESLIEQLVKPGGDIEKLNNALNLAIDARLGKSPDQYVCLLKLDDARYGYEDTAIYRKVYDELPKFVNSPAAMQSFYAYGDRKNYPELTDEQWNRVGWDTFRDCFVCEKRHRCGQTLSRDHYRRAADLIICSHDFYMEHVWTYESRKREGQLPLLPEHSAVVFDEGHLLESAAQKALTYRLKHMAFEELITRLLRGQVRESLAVQIDEAIDQSQLLFAALEEASEPVPGSDRRQIRWTDQLLFEVHTFRKLLTIIEEELVMESAMFSLDEYQLRIVEEHLEMMQKAFQLFEHPEKLISWATESITGITLVLMPKTVKEVLQEHIFSSRMPIIFSSATLSVEGSFSYIAEGIGLEDYLSFSVASSYNYAEQMEVYMPQWQYGGTFSEKMKTAIRMLMRTEGRALILFRTKEELQQFKREIAYYPECAGLQFLYEGDKEISHLIESFQHDEHSVLCAVSLWEGLDIPGPSLSNVIMWSLPFPPDDPVFVAKRQAALRPFEDVDLPYMLLRLKQGMGRLIRRSGDRGVILIMGENRPGLDRLHESIASLLPEGVKLKQSLDE